MKILLATHNPAKLDDYKRIFGEQGFEVVSLEDMGIEEKYEEQGDNFEENARAKALFYYNSSGRPTISEDGGLEIDYLGGEPGVRSRRWPGHEASDKELVAHLQEKVKEIPEDKRTARFTAVACLVKSLDEIQVVKNSTEGRLTDKMRQGYQKGFPYRALFIVDKFNKYYMDLSDEEYDQADHRRRNVEELIKYLEYYKLK